ncbi:MAG TPA: response regulator [Bacteroidota bacterium]|nr:response regulator [Bacteroidota bacterium]
MNEVKTGSMTHQKNNTEPTILIVEDETLIQWSLDHACARAGFRTIVANSAETAIEFFSANRIDIVVSDIGLPRHDGISLARSLRAISPEIPIILVSTETDRLGELHDDLQNVYFREKPFDLDELISLISSILRRSEPRRELDKSAPIFNKSHD